MPASGVQASIVRLAFEVFGPLHRHLQGIAANSSGCIVGDMAKQREPGDEPAILGKMGHHSRLQMATPQLAFEPFHPLRE